jgi:predicted nucleotide-binding protein
VQGVTVAYSQRSTTTREQPIMSDVLDERETLHVATKSPKQEEQPPGQSSRKIIFIGSSSAAKSQARAVIKAFTSETTIFLPWWEAFKAGRTLLEELDRLRARVNAALLLFSPESDTRVRKKKHAIPSLNVLFEFGYFYGRLGRDRVALLKYGEFYMPSDLDGYIHIFGSKSFKRGAAMQVGKRTRAEFARWEKDL